MRPALIFVFLLLLTSVSCGRLMHHHHRQETSSGPRLTKDKVITIAKPSLPLPPHETYHAEYAGGIWKVWAKADAGYDERSWTIVTVRDMDGTVVSTENF
jgi:hypothetical protein